MAIISQPEPGFFRTRLVRHGPWVGARIWQDAAHDPVTGEVLDRAPMLRAEVDGREADPFALWPRVCDRRISPAEYRALRSAAARPGSIQSDPRTPVDINRLPAPSF